MKRLAVSLGMLLALVLAIPVFSDDGYRPDRHEQASNLVIDVMYRVINDGDTRVGGGFWALDDYTKRIQVWEIGPGLFYAWVRYHGSFETLAGPSPQGTGEIAAGVEGKMEGDYWAVITGALKPKPDRKLQGNLGEMNYGCKASDPGNYSTCKTFSWTDAYFAPGYDFQYQWWGWLYDGGKHGVWVNAQGGNQGDIKN